jgi:Uma2 family endonuclease
MAAVQLADGLYSADDLYSFPAELRYELVKGRLREMAPTGGTHGESTSLIGARIQVFVEDNGLGRCFAAETGFLLSREPDTVLAPDFAFVASGRLPGPVTAKFVPLAPDLVVETRSPLESRSRTVEKAHQWLSAGVRMVIDLSPARREVTVYRPGQVPRVLGLDDTFSGEDVLPGFTRPVAKMFA